MTRYHIATSGKSAVCKAASDKACPLGGQHFRSKDDADYYVELQEQAKLDPEATLQELYEATSRARRRAAGLAPHIPVVGSEESLALSADREVASTNCDHVGTGRTIKFDGGRRALLCNRCSTIVGYATDADIAAQKASAQRRAQNPLNAEVSVEEQVGQLATQQRRKNAEALNGEDPGLAVGRIASEQRSRQNEAFRDALDPSFTLRKLTDEEVTSHHTALARYNAAMAGTDKSAIREAAAHLNTLGSKAAGYSWGPEAAEKRLSAEIDRRVAVVNLVNTDLVPRLVQAEDHLKQLRDSAHPATDGENKKRLDAKLAGVAHFRKQWAGKVLQAGSVDNINQVLANFDTNRKLTMTPEGIGGSNLQGPGWSEGLELARDYVAGYLR